MLPHLDIFFARHPVFTVQELDEYLGRAGRGNPETRQSLLAHHRKRGHVVRIRRGIYASVPPGADPRAWPVDPLLVASRLADDAVLAYHTALAYHGVAHSVRRSHTALSRQPHVRDLRFRDDSYVAVAPPAALLRAGQAGYGTQPGERANVRLQVTNLERTLVDVLDRPHLGGGWEEIWRSFDDVGYLDLDQVVTYALLLDSAVAAAKVGYFLDSHRDALMVDDASLERLRQRRPRQARYLGADRGAGRLVQAWNLIVPASVQGQLWQEGT